MAASPAASDASHESGEDGHESQNKSSAVKDKECQYCHQRFTSSSLGRHLDQFISKKKPDGIHNVEEIKKIRAGITRRTAKGAKKGDVSHGDHTQQDPYEKSAQPSPDQSSNQAPTPAFLESLNKSQPGSNDVRFNRMGWQATGVITDPVAPLNTTHRGGSPPIPNGTSTYTTSNAAGTKRSFSVFAADNAAPSTSDTMRALELSLREVLDAVQIATRRATELPRPFPFDLMAQTFPSLCVRLLPPPPTLFQATPFSTPDSIPLSPPGPEQLQALRSKIRYMLDDWKWDALAYAQKTSVRNGMSVAEEAARLSQSTEQMFDDSMRHVEKAFHYFVANSPEQQFQIWNIELLRAFSAERDKVKESKEQIVRLTQEALQLQQQVDHLSRCQWPREMALWPPERNTFSSAIQKELTEGKSSCSASHDAISNYGDPKRLEDLSQEDRWDFDKLVNKWKRHVREDRARRGTMLPPITDADRTSTPMALHKLTSGVNGHRPSSQTTSPTVYNGSGFAPGVFDRTATFANSASAVNKPFAGTPSNNSNPPASRAQTPFQGSNISIVSDIDQHMARFAPWLKQKELEERRERGSMAAGD